MFPEYGAVDARILVYPCARTSPTACCGHAPGSPHIWGHPIQAGRTVADGGVLMSEKKSRPMSPESIFSTLEHISQAIDAMTAVVGELRSYLDEHWEVIEVSSIALEPEELELAEMEASPRTVH